MLRALAAREAARPNDGEGDSSLSDEAALVERAKADAEAFGLLYDRYVDAIFGYCARRLGSREAAEDATSQVFTNALNALPRYRARRDGGFRAWLFTIAYRVVVDGFRDRLRRPTAPLDGVDDLPDPAPSPEDQALAAAERRELERLLALLTADQRRIVELRLAGLTGDEIAAVIGKSRNAVDVAQHRAIQRLRALHARESTPGDEAHD